ncbi:ABC transporter ATP-binding protein [Gracilimonas sp.]|uniref:ABC transporter ATP-binding protein n=1 Tax=Gracilimonas sp. TaxID=1974203 RepID=UPI003BA9B8CB
MVNISSVSKWFGKVRALKEVSFEVNKGELFGVIGPDGAGKTTLFRIINTLLISDKGSATVLGKDVVEDYKLIRPKLGYMPGRFSLYQDLTVEENLRFFASVFGTSIEENYELVKPIYSQLEKFRNRLAGDLSGGMKQKLALSCALIHKPELLLLDEPTTGVDAVSRKEFWEMLQMLKEEGITIIVSTPYMDEADLCERVALIQEGEILQINTPQAIVDSFERTLLGIKADNTYALLNALKSHPQAYSVQPFGEYVHYTEKTGSPNVMALKKYLFDRGLDEVEIKPIKPNIEDSFMELMQANDEEAHV